MPTNTPCASMAAPAAPLRGLLNASTGDASKDIWYTRAR